MKRTCAVVVAVALFAALGACSGSKPATYDAGRSMVSLVNGGWKATRPSAPPDPGARVVQVDYLEATAPDGVGVDLRFLDSPAAAATEIELARARTKGFAGTTAGNIVVIPIPDPTTAVPAVDVASLMSLVRT